MEVRGDIDEKAEHTCEWIFGHQDYRTWIDRGGLLWIKGRAGTGKSTLMNHIRERSLWLQRSSSENTDPAPGMLVLSFFFDRRGDVLHQTAVGLFRSLLHQILRRDNKLLSQFTKDTGFERHHTTKGEPGKDKKWDWTELDLRELFRRHVTDLAKNSNIRLYVDALDEAGEQVARQLMALFKYCGADVSRRFNICASCRPYPERISTYDYCIDIVDETQPDIWCFIQQYFREWPDWSDPVLLRRVKEEIFSRSCGVFQWVVIVAPSVVVLRAEDKATVLASIASLPQDLDDLYHGMFRTLRADKGIHKRTALRLFRWITFAKRPLTLVELRYAVAIDAGSRLNLVDDCKRSAYWCEQDETMFTRLRRLSFGVVKLNGPYVQFDHESVRDYMLARGIASLEAGQLCDSTVDVRGRSEAILSCVSLRYLAADDIVEHSDKVFNQGITPYVDIGKLYRTGNDRYFPFASYTRRFCWTHAFVAEAEGQSLDYIFEITEWPSIRIAYTWRMPAVYRDRRRIGRDLTLQHLAAYYGLARILEQIQSRIQKLKPNEELASGSRSGLDPKDNEHCTPLWYAAHHGQGRIVQLLLESGRVDVNTHDDLGRTPLMVAVAMSHEHVVRLILESGQVNMSFWKCKGRDLLPTAVSQGHESIVKLLLDSPWVNVNAWDEHGRTPLSLAVSGNWENIVKLLLQSDRVNVDAQDDDGEKALASAAGMGRCSLVELLIESGRPDINSEDKWRRTPLDRAVRAGYVRSTAALLAQKDANYNACNCWNETPLLVAAWLGHETIVRMLLEKEGVHIWTKDDNGWTPVEAAVWRGHVRIVRLFWERGFIDANSKFYNKYGNIAKTLLEVAAERGHAPIVRYLLEKGEADMDMDNKVLSFARAAAAGHEETVKVFLETGTVSTKEEFWLMESFVDIGEEGSKPDGTAAELAEHYGHGRVARLIRDYEREQTEREEVAQYQVVGFQGKSSDGEAQAPQGQDMRKLEVRRLSYP